MFSLTLALVGLVLLLVLMRERDARRLDRFLADTARERRSLLDRIQHPERVQVQPVASEPSEAPRDSAELAHVGGIVPEFVDIGTVRAAGE